MTALAIHGGTPRVRPEDHVRWPVLGVEERAAVLGVLERGVLSGPFAPEVRSLEREWAAYVGAQHCLATNSGTAALHMAVMAAGIAPGDHVIVPAFTFVATALAVLHAGAVPVFVDIEPRTLGMDARLVERAITPETRAVIPVHIHGTPCAALDELVALCARRGLVLIEDAAQAHGATHRGRKVGTFGALGCFSIQSSKSLAAGEGGLLVTDDAALFARAPGAPLFGEAVRLDDDSYRIERALDSNRAYESLGMGWMYRTTELTARDRPHAAPHARRVERERAAQRGGALAPARRAARRARR